MPRLYIWQNKVFAIAFWFNLLSHFNVKKSHFKPFSSWLTYKITHFVWTVYQWPTCPNILELEKILKRKGGMSVAHFELTGVSLIGSVEMSEIVISFPELDSFRKIVSLFQCKAHFLFTPEELTDLWPVLICSYSREMDLSFQQLAEVKTFVAACALIKAYQTQHSTWTKSLSLRVWHKSPRPGAAPWPGLPFKWC